MIRPEEALTALLVSTTRASPQAIETGTRILIDDGCLELEVTGKEENTLLCTALNTSVIKGNKSVNVPGVTFDLPAVSPKDREYIEFAAVHQLDFIAHSFVRSKQDILDVQEILDKHQSQAKIIAKIENQ